VDAVQPSEDDSVKVMTVHAAKGLEFDAVFVPGLARGLFPDTRIQQNPARKGSSLDVELRRDRDLLPVFQDNMKAFTDELRKQEEYEERRICYVALTRAKRRLFVSSANWYGETLGRQGCRELLRRAQEVGRGGGRRDHVSRADRTRGRRPTRSRATGSGSSARGPAPRPRRNATSCSRRAGVTPRPRPPPARA
jgi:DNA helicase-2/ATP-dependent DNA helicase PcrA